MNIKIVNKINKENKFVYLIYKDQNGKKVRQEIIDCLNIDLDNEIKKYKIEVSTYQNGLWKKRVFFLFMTLPLFMFEDLPMIGSLYTHFKFKNDRDAYIDVFYDEEFLNTGKNLTGNVICINPLDREGNNLDFKVSYFKYVLYANIWLIISFLILFPLFFILLYFIDG